MSNKVDAIETEHPSVHETSTHPPDVLRVNATATVVVDELSRPLLRCENCELTADTTPASCSELSCVLVLASLFFFFFLLSFEGIIPLEGIIYIVFLSAVAGVYFMVRWFTIFLLLQNTSMYPNIYTISKPFHFVQCRKVEHKRKCRHCHRVV
jgi:hypothetical protein